ncbi:unnamed protein product [Trichobilharzia regenti]|nr:unnamed protein product [Trichobilharzia regenti]
MVWNQYGQRISKLLSTIINVNSRNTVIFASFGSVLSGVFYFAVNDCKHVYMKSSSTDVRRLSLEEKFRTFASLEFHGVILMTPSDFLRSLVNDQTDVKTNVTKDSEFVDRIMKKATAKKYGSRFFRNLQNDGIITFSEYLFLLHILTKSPSGFEIAFKMLDRDMSGSVDAKEFMTSFYYPVCFTQKTYQLHAYNTTLMTHLFGYTKTKNLSFQEFERYVRLQSLQRILLEFYSVILLFLVFLRIWLVLFILTKVFLQTISFNEFQKFFMFLNCLDDFALAVKMYTIAGQPISLPEFKRAVKACTGNELGSDILTVLFALFDIDEDNCLSYQEFIHIMRERHSGGLSVILPNFQLLSNCIYSGHQ